MRKTMWAIKRQCGAYQQCPSGSGAPWLFRTRHLANWEIQYGRASAFGKAVPVIVTIELRK